jgi:hypothetical protein
LCLHLLFPYFFCIFPRFVSLSCPILYPKYLSGYIISSLYTAQTSNTPCPHTSCKVHWCSRWNFRR